MASAAPDSALLTSYQTERLRSLESKMDMMLNGNLSV